MKCLITGAAGFIGSHLTDRFVAEGHSVVGIDNFSTGNPRNIEHLKNESQFTFIEHDISQSLPSFDRVDCILHFASPASPPKYQEKPVETMLVNGMGTYYLLEYARAHQSRFLFASTSEIYGDPQVHPQVEDYWGNVNSIGPRSCYDEAKRFGEALTYTYIRKYEVDGRLVRIFNTYGPRMDINDGRVVTNFIKQVLHNEPLTIYGDGSQTRSFCYVSDLVDIIYKIASVESLTTDRVFNIGNPDEMTVTELAQMVAKIAHVSVTVKNQPLPEDDPVRRKPDITRVRQQFSWQPQVQLSEGLEKTLSYFKNLS